jgi:transcriptional regulator with XRE-family HTH domain
MSWNARLTAAREAAELSKAQLAAALGVTASAVSQWENLTTKELTADLLLKACDTLNVTPHWLLRGEGFGPGDLPNGDDIGSRIRAARSARGLSQEQLAELIGKTKGAVSQWEQGTTTPRRELIDPLARHLGVTVSWLLGRLDADLEATARQRTQLTGMALASKITTALSEHRLTQAQVQLMGDLLEQFLLLPAPAAGTAADTKEREPA